MAKIDFQETARKLADEGMKYIEERLLKDYGVSFDDLEDIVKAKQDGRLVVLPCKVGDKMFDITTGEIVEKSVVSIPFLLSKSANHLCLHAINCRGGATTVEPQDIGKTVFLTREEAEQALKESEQK